MKNLYEGILGNVDDIMDAGESAIRIPELIKRISDQTYHEVMKLGLLNKGYPKSDGSPTSKYVMHSSFRDGVLRLYMPKLLMTPPVVKIIDEIMTGTDIKRMEFPGLFYVDDYNNVDASTFGTNNITALRVQLSNCRKISNMKFTIWNRPTGMGSDRLDRDEWIDPSGSRSNGLIMLGDSYWDTASGKSDVGLVISTPYPRLVLNNVSVDFSRTHNKNKIWFACPCIPDLSGFFCNCDAMLISAEDLFDSKRTAGKVCGVLGVRDLKDLYKTAKKFMKFKWSDENQLTNLGYGENPGRLSDLINLSGCPKCNMVALSDGELCVYFVKKSVASNNDYIIPYPVSMDASKSNPSAELPVTQDGWVMFVTPAKKKAYS